MRMLISIRSGDAPKHTRYSLINFLKREMEEEETEELSGTLDLQEINRMARGDDEDDDEATAVPEGEEGAEDAADDKTRISGDEDEDDQDEDDDEEEEDEDDDDDEDKE